MIRKMTSDNKMESESAFVGTSNWNEHQSQTGILPSAGSYVGIRVASSSSSITYLLMSGQDHKKIVLFYPASQEVAEIITDVDGPVLRAGDYGLGGFEATRIETEEDYLESSSNNITETITFPITMTIGGRLIPPYLAGWRISRNNAGHGFKIFGHDTRLYFGRNRVNEVYSDHNTTLDSNGFIKAASPIIRLFDDRIETNNQFKEEPIFEKIGIGTYKISNTLGLAKEGWTYEKPRGKDGNPYFRIIVKKTDDGCIISVHDEFEALEEATITDIDGNERKINKVVKILGEARDIKPHERWIDLRFHEEPEEIEEIDDLEDFEEEQIDLEKHLEKHNAILL